MFQPMHAEGASGGWQRWVCEWMLSFAEWAPAWQEEAPIYCAPQHVRKQPGTRRDDVAQQDADD